MKLKANRRSTYDSVDADLDLSGFPESAEMTVYYSEYKNTKIKAKKGNATIEELNEAADRLIEADKRNIYYNGVHYQPFTERFEISGHTFEFVRHEEGYNLFYNLTEGNWIVFKIVEEDQSIPFVRSIGPLGFTRPTLERANDLLRNLVEAPDERNYLFKKKDKNRTYTRYEKLYSRYTQD